MSRYFIPNAWGVFCLHFSGFSNNILEEKKFQVYRENMKIKIN